jgi:WhiB family redox-sensing transcriptional regulator
MDKEEWRKQANCLGKDINIFFAEKGDAGYQALQLVKELCDECIVNKECLNYALDNSISVGVYGGFTATQRRGLKRKRNNGIPLHSSMV